MDPPAQKKSKMDTGDDSYIPVPAPSAENSSNLSLMFSLREEKGSLLNALKPFQVGTYRSYTGIIICIYSCNPFNLIP